MEQPPIGEVIEAKIAKNPDWRTIIIDERVGPDHYRVRKHMYHSSWSLSPKLHKNHIKDWRRPARN